MINASLIDSITNLNAIVSDLKNQFDKLNEELGNLKLKYDEQKTIMDKNDSLPKKNSIK